MMATMIQKPCGCWASGMPPTFMPSMPAMILIGKASTVTMVSTNRLRLFSSLTLAAISSCSSLMRSCKRRHIAEHHGKFLRRLAQFQAVQLRHPRRRALQQAEQGGRFRRQQALQPHQHAPHGAQVFAFRHQAPGQQVILDIVDPRHGVAHDVDQHVGLVAQQMDQQFHRRAYRLVVLDDGLAQALDRLQRRAARRDDEVLRHAGPHGGNVGRFEREIVHHIVDHGDQGVFRLFDARRARTLVQGFIEFVGQLRVRHQPFFAGRMRQIEMQPDEFLRRAASRHRPARPARPSSPAPAAALRGQTGSPRPGPRCPSRR